MTSRAVQWIGFALLVFFLSFDVARAAPDKHFDTEAEAWSSCNADKNAVASYSTTAYAYEANDCALLGGDRYQCTYKQRHIPSGSYHGGTRTCANISALSTMHYFENEHTCDSGTEFTSSTAYSLGSGGSFDFDYPSEACNAGCVYANPQTAAGEFCFYTDTNGNGVQDPEEDNGYCDLVYTSTGGTCAFDGSDGQPSLPGQQPRGPDDENTPCYTDVAGGCGPGSEPNLPNFPNDPNNPGNDPDEPVDPGDDTGGNEGTGDGDPDTPGDGPGGSGDDSTGTGDGDTDGDDEREVDCNPLSNPDCSFRGSGSSSNDCSEAPSCSGDPVQCTILKQSWRAMCYPFLDTGGTIPEEQLAPIQDVEDGDFWIGREVEVDISDGLQFDESGFIGAASCPADKVANLGMLGTFTIPFTPICTLAEMLSFLIMMAAYYAAFRIITGSLQI